MLGLLTIRFARPEDFEAIIELGADVFTPFGDYRNSITRWLQTDGVRCFVAYQGRSFCGAVILAFFPDAVGFYTEILAIEVARDVRQRGVGTVLMETVIEFIEELGKKYPVSSIRLSTADTNQPARTLFDKLGFVATDEDVGYYDGGQKIVRMRLDIDAAESRSQ